MLCHALFKENHGAMAYCGTSILRKFYRNSFTYAQFLMKGEKPTFSKAKIVFNPQ